MSASEVQAQAPPPATTAMQGIVDWSAGLPSWQRDALRRLCQQEQLSEQDIAELLDCCIGRHKSNEQDSAKNPEPLTADHVHTGTSAQPVALRSLKDVQHVNALAAGQVLGFRESGLTIVFGGNGSGKSGYARVLKKACRARSANVPILPNAYASPPGKPATAAIVYSVGGKPARPASWTDGSPTDSVLSAISVFDSACAVAHVEGTNDVAYTPAALDLLSRLAEICRELKRRLSSEQQSLQAAIPLNLVAPKSRPQTKVGMLVALLSASSDMTAFEALAVLTEVERGRLETLRADLTNDPRQLAEQLRLRKQRLLQVIAKIELLNGAVTDLAADGLKQLVADASAKAEAARVAADELFKGKEPLPTIGSDAWRSLWEAARAYSQSEAYPNQEFPVTTDDARCVLCQQELEAEAASRLTRFEAFVKASAQKQAADARQAMHRARNELLVATFTHKEQTDAVGQVRDELTSPAQADVLRRFLAIARWRRRRLMKASNPEAWPTLPALPDSPVAGLRALDAELDRRIHDLQNAGNAEARRVLEQEVQELEDRVWLSTVLDDVKKDITRRKNLNVISSAIDDTDTTGITRKSTGLAEKLVTKALKDKFTEEANRLEIKSVKVTLEQATSQYGVPKFRVSLVANPTAELGRILSEGEHRCIALAAFLSELATADDQSGIVFDDPVSSLDHDYRQAVAKRLAEESKDRQVIVFTHDIVFLTQLAEQARRVGVQVGYQSVARGEESSGFCTPEAPMRVRPVLDALAGLEKHLTNVSHAYKTGDMGKWWREVKSIAGDLRDLWERAVEQALSPVYSRFDYKVETMGLVKATILTEQDCRVMREGFGRCSKLMHSEPAPVGSKPPEPAALQHEIDDLRRWLEDILKRQDAVKPV